MAAKHYGMDAYNYTLLAVSLIFCVSPYTICVALFIWGVVLYRALSRKYYDRSRENQRLVELFGKLSGRRGNRAARAEKRKNARLFSYFACPFCGSKMRAPAGMGRLRVTCTACRKAFQRHT